jgi:hypothetical protein
VILGAQFTRGITQPQADPLANCCAVNLAELKSSSCRLCWNSLIVHTTLKILLSHLGEQAAPSDTPAFLLAARFARRAYACRGTTSGKQGATDFQTWPFERKGMGPFKKAPSFAPIV